MKKFPKFKIRCSAISNIMGIKGLGKTGYDYLNEWMKEQIYERRKDFASKYFDKGNACEDEAIQYAAENLGWGEVHKNDEWFENDFMQGTPDVMRPKADTIIDIKNSWDCFTFPLYDTIIPSKGYDDQLQGYTELTNYGKAQLVYCLMDAPLDLMKKEMSRLSWKEGYRGEIPPEVYQKVKEDMTYSNLPPELRLKVFEVERDPKRILAIADRVLECRKYIESTGFYSQSFLKEIA
ncbi:hypothetical protein ORI89_18695 [Sphingobacterium sp. UT-1RO-CII-1]|uniref:hypothetical protein n=1 Tax=Sphingobacterium sp. UT-1RO-CII-1 TaxID=2995225 RepID=UPI00227B9B48|nr:hypothetical protein [Sphingobacterium sp. UT-1RO-CII-1]MCY4781686.1 hypothetical protein [Sphingobacterium sp. UT-1RO-CII-1]